jgi:hypothetical protein
MRIPVYASNAVATSEAPGASIRARMDPNVFVQAELAKGQVLGSALEQINKYALARAEAEAKIQYNEAMLGAEVEMRDLADSLKDSSRLGDVLNEKGTGAWQVATKDMRLRLADGLSSRSMTDAFNARFDQQEVTVRFQLRDAVETRINARAAAASAARQDSVVAQLSDPRMDPATAAMLLASSDADMRADQAAGIVTPEMAANINSAMVNKIAGNLVSGFVGSDPARGIALAKALELQDEVNAGTITAERAALDSGLEAGSAYTLAVIRLATPDVATKVIADAITQANKINGAMDEANAEKTAAEKVKSDNLYNSTFGVDPNAAASFDLTMRLFETNSEAFNRAKLDASQPITGKQYLDAAAGFLDFKNVLSQEQRKSLDTHRNPNVDGPFAKQSNPAVYASLFQKQLSGDLTMPELNALQGDLSLSDWKALTEGIQTESSQSFQLLDDAVAAKFNFNKFTAPNDDAGKESQAAYAYVSSQLLSEFNAARAAGNPMTSTQMTARSNELVAERMVTYRASLQDQLQQYLEKQRSNGIPSLTPGSEVVELDAWYNSLTEPTAQQRSIYFAVKANINRMMGN